MFSVLSAQSVRSWRTLKSRSYYFELHCFATSSALQSSAVILFVTTKWCQVRSLQSTGRTLDSALLATRPKSRDDFESAVFVTLSVRVAKAPASTGYLQSSVWF